MGTSNGKSPHFDKGRQSRIDGVSREQNPYSLRNQKGHDWDEGGAQREREVQTPHPWNLQVGRAGPQQR